MSEQDILLGLNLFLVVICIIRHRQISPRIAIVEKESWEIQKHLGIMITVGKK